MKNKVLKLIIIFDFFLAILYILLSPHIILNGPSVIKIDVNSKYQEKGVKIYSLKKYEINTKNNINTKKIGEYKVEYIVNNKYKKTRKIIVVDREKPIIKLNGNKITNVCNYEKYNDEGATATDNYDGDLTSKIKTKKQDNKIIYTVKDSSGNKSELIRELIVKDEEAPVITLNGDDYIYISQGGTYIEQGASAIDNCDGDISSNIKISGIVDTNSLGEYKIEYEVTDNSSNKTTIERKIKVISNTEKIIYLTFDDGPSYSITPKLLDILKEENVKATFFIINHSDNLNYLIKREYDEGHTVAIHSYTHNYGKIYASVDAYFDDLNAMKSKIKNIIGIEPKLIRFPGGSSNTISKFNPGIMTTLSKEVINRGYIYVDWNVSSGDAGDAYTKEQIYNNVINNLNSKVNVVLMHDFESNYKTLNAIKDIIETAKTQGYQFKALDENSPIIRHRINN